MTTVQKLFQAYRQYMKLTCGVKIVLSKAGKREYARLLKKINKLEGVIIKEENYG